jgi:pilus assembly protein CpaC
MRSSACSRAALATAAAAAIVMGSALVAAQPAAERRELELQVTEQIRLPTAGVAHWSDSIKGIIDIKQSEKQPNIIVIAAMAPGTTSLLLIMNDGSEIHYTITVHPRERSGAVEARDNIRLDFYFVEMTAGGSHRIGLAWPGTVGGTGTLGADIGIAIETDLRTSHVRGATATITGQVLPRLDLAQSAGWAKVLRHAALVMTNGEAGTFSSGGELNVRVGNGLAAGLSQIEHGTRVTVSPRYDKGSGRLEIQIQAQVATLSGDGVDGLPGRNLTRVDTVLNVELGEAVVLAGLLGEDVRSDRAGLPWLVDIPVLGYLFGTHAGERRHTENALIIVPTVVEAVSGDRRAIVDSAMRELEGFRGSFQRGWIMDLVQPSAPGEASW